MRVALSSTPYDPTAPCPSWQRCWPQHGSPVRKVFAHGQKGCSPSHSLSDHGLYAEFPFPDLSSPGKTQLGGLVATPDVATLRLAVHATHPLGGPGILVVTTVPIHHENTVIAARILNELNRIECKQSVKTISTGAWCLDPKLKRFSHVSFWPTARVDSSMVPDLLAREESRIRWVHRTLKSMGVWVSPTVSMGSCCLLLFLMCIPDFSLGCNSNISFTGWSTNRLEAAAPCRHLHPKATPRGFAWDG